MKGFFVPRFARKTATHPNFISTQIFTRLLTTPSDFVNTYNINITEIHPQTENLTLRHWNEFHKYANNNIFASHTLLAFEEATKFVDKFYESGLLSNNSEKLVILDSGCGVGLSTMCLSSLHPNVVVIGIDRSITRLSRNIIKTNNNEEVFVTLNSRVDGDEDTYNQNYEQLEGEDADDYISKEVNDTDISKSSSILDDSSKARNVLFLRAEISDFLLLIALRSDWIIHSHYMLYPNPYPKPKHLKVVF